MPSATSFGGAGPRVCCVTRAGRPLAVAVLSVLAFGGGAAQAQVAVTGRVTMADGEGVPGVRVDLPALEISRITDVEGRFTVPAVAPGRYVVRAGMIGCRDGTWTIDVAAEGPLGLDLRLGGPAVSSGTVVRSGVAAEMPEEEVPFTVERLTRAEIERLPRQSVAELIRGAFPGVKVVQGSGMPGSSASVQLRGVTSMSGDDQPLVVVDGMISAAGLEDVDPLDIESIEILKGPVAAAFYGSRGESGVISIETRKGMPDGPRCVFRLVPSL